MATATVKGGFFAQYGATYSHLWGRGSFRRLARMTLSGKAALAMREKMETLNGAAAGSTATKQLKRVAHSEELGGVRAVETETFVNTATVAADVTDINDSILTFSTKTYDPTPVANGDGNPLGTR